MLDDRRTLPACVELLQVDRHTGEAELEIVLTEGRNRQIRRVADLLGHPVRALHRLAIGDPTLRAPTSGELLERGEYRHLAPQELQDLRQSVAFPHRRPDSL